MNGELEEIREFLDHCPDLAPLPKASRDAFLRQLTLRYLREGTSFPPDAEPGLWIVRTGTLEIRDAQDTLHDRLGEGDLVHIPNTPARPLGPVTEDALVYHLPLGRALELAARDDAIAQFLDADAPRPLATDRTAQGGHGDRSLLTTPVRALMTCDPILAVSTLSLREAARLMDRGDISALLLHTPERPGEPCGILTDTDLRRAVANGVDPGQPVAESMASPLTTVERGTPAFEALLRMARHDIHHLPVVHEADGTLAGILSSTDLIRHQGTSAIYLVRDLRRADDLAGLQGVMQALPQLQVQLVEAGADAAQLTQTVTTVIDTLTQRLIELDERDRGPAPCAFAWLASGSQGRHEQTVFTDQDTALIIADDASPDVDVWFAELARGVTAGLDACGIRACPGDVDPTHPDWRRPAADWAREMERVLHHPAPRDAMLATHYLDMRVILGAAELFEPLRQQALEVGARHEALLSTLADQARNLPPPLGFFRQFVLEDSGAHADTLDLKMRGLLPIVAMARVFALHAGSAARSTVERLSAAARAGVIHESTADNLADAWLYIANLRARHQARQIRNGQPPDNALDPAGLSTLERSHLKTAFRLVNDARKTAL
ncbi:MULTISPECIES: putative nucleotidyltransferase substrate binding domain-containing protein [unclassified Thioalkalivibrio]|uniref:putative nucleotidyltransferase substrate binding domain-containing protein n=1 Tax=unclassified Thioalkalivibrio TaxID=2621013 RepID=UPI00037AD54D|nr:MULTISPECIES: putative nucleotidyltransferase substrate binding domain-containing protein [unclassified Thioalkalivibrio]